MSKKWRFLLAVALVFLPLSSLAIQAHSNDRVVIEVDQVVDSNLYVAANVLEIKGTVNGDIFAAGQTIYIESDNINGDIFAIAENITIKGDINGSVRVIGAKSVVITDTQVKNLMAIAEDLRVGDNTVVNRHLSFLTQYTTITGSVGGNVEGATGDFLLDSTVEGDVDLYLGFEDDGAKMHLTDNASIIGTMRYQSWREQEINQNANLVNQPVYSKIVKKEKDWGKEFNFMGKLVHFFGLLVFGMILLYISPLYFSNMYNRVKKHWLRSLLRGFGFLVLTPIACILVALTVIGFPVALASMTLWLVLLYVAKIMSAWFVGSFVKNTFINNNKFSNLATLALGILIVMIVDLIPYVGPIALALVYLMAWGIFYDTFYKVIKK